MAHERILVADDENDVRDLCQRALRRAGYDVIGAANGSQAIEVARTQPFDLLLTDIKMPVMSGLDAFRSIRVFKPELAAVVMTGYGTLESAIEALRLGVSEFVLKPFRPDDLTQAVGRALARHRMERENARLKALIPLFDLNRVLTNAIDAEHMPTAVTRIAREEMRADCASLMSVNDKGHLTLMAGDGLPYEGAPQPSSFLPQGILRELLAQRKPMVLRQPLPEDPDAAIAFGSSTFTSAIALPLVHRERLLGIMSVAKLREETPFNPGDEELFTVLGSQVAVAMDNARLLAEIQTAYQRLSELDHLKSEFISIASHELRSPLAVVLSYTTLLEDEATGPMREHMSQVVQAAMQLRSVIDEMVSLRRLDTGEAQVHIASCALAGVVQESLEDLRLLVEGKRQRTTVNLPPDLASVRADDQLLRLILGNLISNAIKFTPEGGAIDISAHMEGQRVITAVHDTGVGIPEEEQERIFQRFYQVEDSLRRRHGGIGLGLAIAREMADLMDGRIWVQSQPGRGSTFYLSLPAAA